MQLLQNIGAIDLALLIKDNLIIADLHIGYEDALTKTGVFVPRYHFQDQVRRMEKIFKKLSKKQISSIIINGDFKHEFGTVSGQEWRHALQFLTLLEKHAKSIILIRGNHDSILGPIAKKKDLAILNEHFIGNILITHGDKLPSKESLQKAKTIIIGHEHPSVKIGTELRTEQYKCYFVGHYKKKNLIVMPSFNLLAQGSDPLLEEPLGPFLKQTKKDFDIYIVEDKVYHFGKLGKLNQFD